MGKPENPCAVVLGGHVNGYSIIQELADCGVKEIALVVYHKSSGMPQLATRSRYVNHVYRMQKSAESLRNILETIHERHDLLVVYPTDDHQLELLCQLAPEISGFCFLPLNPEKTLKYQDKFEQYAACERFGVPYPKTVLLHGPGDLDSLRNLMWPVIVKPVTRQDITTRLFRLKIYDSMDALLLDAEAFAAYFKQGQRFIASEVIPGDGSTLYSHVAYLGQDGRIVNDWAGRKYSQRPDDFGVFATAGNIAPAVVSDLGRKLTEGIGITGFTQTEFKYDHRDGQYKLMEINQRPHMWNRMGHLTGVSLNLAHWQKALGLPVEKQEQNLTRDIRFTYLRHELHNRIEYGRAYRDRQKRILRGGDRLVLAVYDKHDIKPFLSDLLSTGLSSARLLLRKLTRR